MKKLLVFLSASALVFWMTGMCDATLIDYVDIGNPASETGHTMDDWGPVQPAASGGNWGAPVPTETCRVLSHYPYHDTSDWASIVLDFGAGGTLFFTHLEGIAKDSFYVYADSPGTPAGGNELYYYPGDNAGNEYWLTTEIPIVLSGMHTVYFVSDQPHWYGYTTYGQVAVSEIGIKPTPIPASVLLLGSGILGLVGVGRFRFRMRA